MFRTGKIRWVLLTFVVVSVVFIYAKIDIAVKSIRFDLRKIAEGMYEARSKSGKWPEQLADLEETEYLRMPHRRAMLEQGMLVIV